MGDIFMHRRPSPKVLLKFRDLIAFITKEACLGDIHILRGNHDSETKADDGITALSLFERENIYVYTQVSGVRETIEIGGVGKKCVFVPHYEDQKLIKRILDSLNEEFVAFGHFGYDGCLNSLGNCDFTIGIDDFNCPTYLGHIHRYLAKTNAKDQEIILLGTQYTTNFGEAGKESYYGLFEDQEFKLRISKGGPKHIISYYNDDYFLETLNIPEDNFVILRIFIDPIAQKVNGSKLKMDIMDRWENVKAVEINYKSAIDNLDDLSNYKGNGEVLTIDEDLIKSYVKENSANLPFDDLMSGFYKLSEALNENK
jgi:hypothetical protein